MRTPDISPRVALIISYLIAAAFMSLIVSLGYVPRSWAEGFADNFGRKGCMLTSDQVDASYDAGASDVRIINNENEVTRALAWVLAQKVDPPYPTTKILLARYPKADMAVIYYADGAWICGYTLSTLATGNDFWDYVKSALGDPA